MSAARDPYDMSSMSVPSAEELDETEQLLAELSSGLLEFTSDPMAQLLLAARGPATADEVADTTGFAHRVAVVEPRPPTILDEHDLRGPVATRYLTLGLVGRALAAKAALIAAVGVLGVAGAGAATGVIVATHRSDPSLTSVVPTSAVTSARAGTGSTLDDPPSVTTSVGTDQVPVDPPAAARVIDPAPVITPSDTSGGRSAGSGAGVAPASDGPPSPTTGAANGDGMNAGGNPTPGSTGAANGDGMNAGGNPTPGSTGAANGDGMNAGGNPTPGSTGAANGDGMNAGGNPTPGSTGAANAHSTNAGGTANNGDPGAEHGNDAARSGAPTDPVIT